MKSNFHIVFKTCKVKEKLEASLGKNLNNYKKIRNETSAYEQKPIKVDDFNEIEEKQVKEWVERRKQRKREETKNNKLLKKNRSKIRNKKKQSGNDWVNLIRNLRTLRNKRKSLKYLKIYT